MTYGFFICTSTNHDQKLNSRKKKKKSVKSNQIKPVKKRQKKNDGKIISLGRYLLKLAKKNMTASTLTQRLTSATLSSTAIQVRVQLSLPLHRF